MGFVLGDRQGLEVRCKAKVREQTALVLLCKSVQSQLLLRSAQNTLVEPIRLLSQSCCIDRPCSRHRNGFAATFLLLGDWIVHPRERCTTAFYLLLSSEKWAAADGSHYGVDAAAPDESDVFVFFVLPLSLDSRRYSSQLLALMALLLNLVMTPFSTQPHVCGGCLPSFSSGRIQTMLLPSVPVSVSGHPCVCVCVVGMFVVQARVRGVGMNTASSFGCGRSLVLVLLHQLHPSMLCVLAVTRHIDAPAAIFRCYDLCALST